MSDQGAGNIPVTGDEHVLLQNDEGAWIGEASTQQIADLAPGGPGDLSDAVILAPTDSARNVIEGVGGVVPLTVKAEAGQTVSLFTLKDENNATLLMAKPNADEGALVTHHQSADADAQFRLYSGSNDDFTEATNEISAAGTGIMLDSYVDKNDATQSYTVIRGQAQVGQTVPLIVVQDEVGADAFTVDPVAGTTTLSAHTGQTEPLLEWKNENGDTVAQFVQATPWGGAGFSSPTPGRSWVNVGASDANLDFAVGVGDDGRVYFEAYGTESSEFRQIVNDLFAKRGAGSQERANVISAATVGDAGTATLNPDSDVDLDAGWVAIGEFALRGIPAGSSVDGTVGVDLVATDTSSVINLRARVGQTVGVLQVRDADGVVQARVLPSGAIGTSGGEPADGDINPGECFRYFIPTNGAAKTGFKGKTLDGTVVKREDAIP